jgi:ABC-type Fe3+-hydroxamate transport system substrate-binding protein
VSVVQALTVPLAKRALRWYGVLALVGLLPACADSSPSAQPGGFPRTVIDLTGQVVTVPRYPAVIASVGDSPILDRMIAPADRVILSPAALPASWDAVGLLILSSLDAAAYPALVESAQAAGVSVFQVVPITTLSGWENAVARLGETTGRDQNGQDILSDYHRWRAAAEHRPRGDAARVLVLTPEGYTFGQNTLITEILSAAGKINAAAQAGYADYRQVDDAALRALAPDVILLTPAWDVALLIGFVTHPAYADLPAVQRGRVFRLPFSPTAPPDPGFAVWWLAWVEG